MTVLVEPSLTEMVNSIRHTNRPCRLSWVVFRSRFTIGPRINMGTLNAMFFKWSHDWKWSYQQPTGNTRTADIILSQGFFAPDKWQKKIFMLSHLFFKNPQPTSHHRINDMQFNDHYFYNFKSQVLKHPLSHDSFVPRQSKRRCGGKVLNEEEFLVTGSNLSRGTVLWHKLVGKKHEKT